MDKQKIKREIVIVVVALIIYIFNRVAKSYINIPLIDYICRNHLNDFLGGVVFCAYTNIILIIFKRKAIHSLTFLIPYMIIVGICWEYLLPFIFSYSTSDFWDVVSYTLGGVMYYCIIVLILKKEQ